MSGIPYDTLNHTKREIRLLKLEEQKTPEKSKDHAEEPLRCKFIKVSLDLYTIISENDAMCDSNTRPTLPWRARQAQRYSQKIALRKPTAYCALSYVWGEPARVCDIEVNGVLAKIPQNLSDALRSIRANTKTRVIWADAVCINQDDNHERSLQVREMATIYRRAHTVISWLGSGTRRLQLGIEEIARLQNKSQDDRSFFDHMKQMIESADRWNTLLGILYLPYWTRMWIFQEMVCARSRLFLCGNVALMDIDQTLYNALRYDPGASKLEADSMATKRSLMLFAVRDFEKRRQMPAGQRPSLLELLSQLRALQCSDKRDLVYALVSIVEDGQGLVADYSKSIETVFTETAAVILRKGHFDMLLDALRLRPETGLPTWVPNWAATREQDLNLNPGIYSICPKEIRARPIKPSSAVSLLSLYSFVVDEVERIGAVYQPPFNTWLESTEDLVWDHSKYMAAETHRHSLHRQTVRLDTVSMKQHITMRLLSGDAIYGNHTGRVRNNLWIRDIRKCYNALRESKPIPILPRTLDIFQGFDGFPSSYAQAVTRLLLHNEGALPFRTVTGYSCLCSDGECKVGDLVVIVPGVGLPMILRKVDLDESPGTVSYCLTGVAYVHGIMDGEFFNELREQQNIVLC